MIDDEQKDVIDELDNGLKLLIEKFVNWKDLDATLNKVDLARIALASVTQSLDDPFTNYMPESSLHRYNNKKKGKTEGIGLELAVDHTKTVRVVSPICDSPSHRPEIHPGMELKAVNNQPVTNLNIQQISNKLMGAPGTEVIVELIDQNNQSVISKFTRSAYEVRHMRYELLENTIAYFRIAWFSGTLFEEFNLLIRKSIEQGAKGVILDMRTTSGGSTANARKIFSAFCNEDVMYYGVRQGGIKEPDLKLGETFLDLPLVIIVNERSYSAAEILAGAFQDYGRGTVIGEATAGKGIMQNVFPLGGQIGGALRITSAANTTPKGRVFQGNGITPDIVIPLSFSEMFVDTGPQNILDEGRMYSRKLWEQQLMQQNDEKTIEPALDEGDKQLKTAISEIKKLFE